MAERRMISKSFIHSAAFMKMSDSAKLLYFYLSVNADDDGIVEVYPYYKMLSIPEDDVKNLLEKEFIVFLNEDMLSFLPHWLQNNQLRSDRYKPSVYRNMLLNSYPKYIRNVKKVKKEQLDKSLQIEELSSDTAIALGWSTNGIPEIVDYETQSSLDKSSLEKDRIEKDSLDKLSLIKENREESELEPKLMPEAETIKDRLFNMNSTEKEDVLLAASDAYLQISTKDLSHLLTLTEKYNNDLVIEALAISKMNRANTINYTFKILKSFEEKGIINRQKLIESESDTRFKNKLIKSESIPSWIEPILEKTVRETNIYKKYFAEKTTDSYLTLKKLHENQLFDIIEIIILKRWLVRERNNK